MSFVSINKLPDLQNEALPRKAVANVGLLHGITYMYFSH